MVSSSTPCINALDPVLVYIGMGNLLSNKIDWFAPVSRYILIGFGLVDPGA